MIFYTSHLGSMHEAIVVYISCSEAHLFVFQSLAYSLLIAHTVQMGGHAGSYCNELLHVTVWQCRLLTDCKFSQPYSKAILHHSQLLEGWI